ncbi:unnamed protein product [Penicillium pancosmium]
MASSVHEQPLVEGTAFDVHIVDIALHPRKHYNPRHYPPIHNQRRPSQRRVVYLRLLLLNYLLKGEGQEQTWLTATAPEELVEKYGSYSHGNPHGERKICLDREMLDQNQLTDVTVVESSDMIERFLFEAKRASESSKRTDAPLLLLIFCHGLPNHHFLLDDENRENNLSMRTLKDVLAPGTRTTLVTTACYSGGWAVTPALNTAASTGAGPTGCEERIQPKEPTDEQTLAYDAFRQSVLDACQNTATRLSSSSFQHFTFSAHNDDWEYSWTGRTGIPLAQFEERWKRLKTHLYTGSEDNQTKRVGGDAKEEQTIIDTMPDHMAHERLKEMARIFHSTTCPYDWTLCDHVTLSSRLFCFYELGLNLEQAGTFEATMRFRWEAALFADYIVETFRLPVPWDEICIMWHDCAWANAIEKKISASEYSQRWLTIAPLLEDIFDSLGVCHREPGLPVQGPSFHRPFRYVVAALIEANKPEDELTAVSNEIKEAIKNVRTFQNQRVCQDEEVKCRGREWLESLGRRAR